MAAINLGKIFITPKGTWSKSSSYNKLDLVTYSSNGLISTYLSVDNVPSGISLTNTQYWMCIASSLRGEQGERGVDGLAGDSAYIVAVKNGFSGTQTEWLQSLKSNIQFSDDGQGNVMMSFGN